MIFTFNIDLAFGDHVKFLQKWMALVNPSFKIDDVNSKNKTYPGALFPS